MGNHFREPDTFVQFTPKTRDRIVQAIEGLVDLLDQCDGESDFEDDGTGEPWLSTAMCEDKGTVRPGADDRELEPEHDEDGGDDEPNGDDEPWLGNGGIYINGHQEYDLEWDISDNEPWLAAAAVGWGHHYGGLDHEADGIEVK